VQTFDYVAFDGTGARVAGRLRAGGELDLDRLLEARGLTLTRFRVASRRQRARGSLEGLARRLERPAARRAVEGLIADLRAGNSLSTAMDRRPRTFPAAYRASIRAAEASGELDSVLRRLARNLTWAVALRATTTRALIYPALLVAALTGLVVVLLTFVLPRVVGLFPGGRADLPGETRAVLAVSELLTQNAVGLFGCAALVVLGAWWARRYDGWRIGSSDALLRVPRLGSLVRRLATSRFASTASLLHAAGCDVRTMLRVAGQTCGHAGLAAAFARCADAVRRGRTITGALEDERRMDPLLVQLVEVGEATGSLEHCLDRLVEHYDEEVPRAVERFLAWFEPLLLLVFGGLVLFVLLAATLPLFSLYDAV